MSFYLNQVGQEESYIDVSPYNFDFDKAKSPALIQEFIDSEEFANYADRPVSLAEYIRVKLLHKIHTGSQSANMKLFKEKLTKELLENMLMKRKTPQWPELLI